MVNDNPRLPQIEFADGQYVPGVCNIGPAEIARRRRAGHFGALLTVAAYVAMVVLGVPPVLRFVVALPAAASASGYLQARLKFCAGFGQLGVFNFESLGTTVRVDDPVARARDRAKARQIGIGSAVIGALVGIVAVLLPVGR